MITFILSIPRIITGGLTTIRGFFRHLGQAIVEVQENRAKLEAEVFCRYNRVISQAEKDHVASR